MIRWSPLLIIGRMQFKSSEGWECDSVGKILPNTCKVLGVKSHPAPQKEKKGTRSCTSFLPQYFKLERLIPPLKRPHVGEDVEHGELLYLTCESVK
jgi:hypothetical protein